MCAKQRLKCFINTCIKSVQCLNTNISFYYYSHFADEKSEAQIPKIIQLERGRTVINPKLPAIPIPYILLCKSLLSSLSARWKRVSLSILSSHSLTVPPNPASTAAHANLHHLKILLKQTRIYALSILKQKLTSIFNVLVNHLMIMLKYKF